MTQTSGGANHYNLYYIYEADKAEHKMPEETAKKIKNKIFEILSENIKPPPDPIPLY